MIVLLPLLCEGLGHGHTHGHLDEFETVFVLATYLLGYLDTLLEVEIYLVFFWLRTEAEPSGHSIVLKFFRLYLRLIILKDTLYINDMIMYLL